MDIEHKKDERIIMKIRGALVDILLDIDPDKYQPFVTCANSTNQDRDNIPANLAKRFELLEQRFHSPSICHHWC